MLPRDESAPEAPPPGEPEEGSLPPDDGPLEEPVVGNDDLVPVLPGEDFSSEPMSDEVELAEPPPAAPAPAPRPARHRPSGKGGGATQPPVEPAPVPDAPATRPDFNVLMKSLPVVRTTQRDRSTDETALAGATPGPGGSGSGPLDRRWPVAASVVLICGALGAQAVTGWRRRRRYWI
jgi:hypothetical protein